MCPSFCVLGKEIRLFSKTSDLAKSILPLHSVCARGHEGHLNGYCEGAINSTFPFFKFMNRTDFNLEFDTKIE